jgi:hypothetical protein
MAALLGIEIEKPGVQKSSIVNLRLLQVKSLRWLDLIENERAKSFAKTEKMKI